MKVIIKLMFILLYNVFAVYIYYSGIWRDLNTFGLFQYFPIWLLGFANGGNYIMTDFYDIYKENEDYKRRFKNENF